MTNSWKNEYIPYLGYVFIGWNIKTKLITLLRVPFWRIPKLDLNHNIRVVKCQTVKFPLKLVNIQSTI